MLDTLGDLKRTNYAGALRASDADKDVVLMGWVHRRRDLGQLIFIDLRDRAGIAQIVFNKELHPEAHKKAEELRAEFVVAVEGHVLRRQKANPEISTGEVEVMATRLHILNNAKTPPFQVEDEVTASEETRLRYRYLDLRRPRPHRNLELRHRVILEMRKTMDELGFFEIETPMLTRSTPEGARDYLVPSRIHHGQFYALPQSPQIFKQILMISGMDRYFQIVRCFRDEDLRADRQPEFTQIDVEMSFPRQEDVFDVIEKVMERVCAVANEFRDEKQGDAPIKIHTSFPRMTYEEAMLHYGSDKPDLRFKAKLIPLDEMVSLASVANLGIMSPIVGFHFSQQNLRLPSPLSKTAIKNLVQTVVEQADRNIPEVAARSKSLGKPALFIDWCIVGDQQQLLRNPSLTESISNSTGAKTGDILFLGALRGETDPKHKYLIHRCFDILRNRLKQYTKEFDPKRWEFLWVTNFQLFEWSESDKHWVSAQHPFTGIIEEDLDKLETAPWECRSKGYDLVLNGVELGSGSIRIHRQDVQERMFKALGLTEQQAQQRFGFFLNALTYGTPPHGGIALGVDRIMMLLAGETSIREVIAFPKTTAAQDLMADSPSSVTDVQEDELELMISYPELLPVCLRLAEFCDELLRLIQKACSGSLPVNTHFQQSMSLILAKARADARAAVKVAKAGYGSQAAGLSRSLVEAAINSSYIQKNPEERGLAFLKSLHDQNRRLANRLTAHEPSRELQDAIEEARKHEEVSGWPNSVRARAYDVAKPNYSYDIVFLMLSQMLHSDVSSVAGQLEETAPGQWLLETERSNRWVDTALFTVFVYLKEVTEVAFVALAIPRAQVKDLSSRFEEFHKSIAALAAP